MKIRKANKFDFPQIYEMLVRAQAFWSVSLRDAEPDEEHIRTIFNQTIYGGGLTLLAFKDDQLIGIIMGIVAPMTWFPNQRVLHELVYWVDQDHRRSTAGYRLLANFASESEKMLEEGHIHASLICKMSNSPDLKYHKFGYKQVEETWVLGV